MNSITKVMKTRLRFITAKTAFWHQSHISKIQHLYWTDISPIQ